MTGNTVMLGYSLATGSWLQASGTAVAIASYIAGVFTGSSLSGPIRQSVRQSGAGAILWPRRTTAILALELLLLLIVGADGIYHAPVPGSLRAHGLVCLGAFAIGLQSAAMLALCLHGVVTTYITGTWTALASGLAVRPQGDGQAASRHWQHLATQALVLLTYCAAAALSGALSRANPHLAIAGLLPAGLLALVVAAAALRNRNLPVPAP